MSALPRRLETAEKRIARLGNPADAILMAAITRGTFTGKDLDRLFNAIHQPFRAAVLAASAYLMKFSGLPGPPGTVLGDFAMYLGHPHIGFAPSVDPDAVLARCQMVLLGSEEEVDSGFRPDVDNRDRILRGLAQRLVDNDGLDNLRKDAEFFWTNPLPSWPLPVLDDTRLQRLKSLVAPLERDDGYLILWRNPDDTAGWEYRPRM